MSEVLLEISKSTIRTFHCYAFMHGILGSSSAHRNFLYSYYGSVCFEHSFNKDLWDSFDLFPAPRVNEWRRIGLIDVETIDCLIDVEIHRKDPVEIISERLLEGKYCRVNLDDYYVEGRPAYHRRHCVHDMLVVGIDFDSDRVALFGYIRTEEEEFGLKWIALDAFRKAFAYDLNFKGAEKYAGYSSDAYQLLHCYSLVSDAKFDLDVDGIVLEIECHLNGTCAEGQSAMHNKSFDQRKVSYGIKTYDAWVEFLCLLRDEGGEMDSSPVRIFWEHKFHLVERFEYMHRHAGVPIERAAIDELLAVAKLARTFSMLANEKGALRSREKFQDLVQLLELIQQKEERCFHRLLRTMSSSVGG